MTGDLKSLFDKLKSLGVQVGAKNIQAPPTPASLHTRTRRYGIEEVITGFDLTTPLGMTFVTEQHYPHNHQHGWIPLCQDCTLQALASWGNAPRMTDPSIRNVVFLDTETTGLAGGTGTHAFLVGIGYRTEQGFHLAQFFMRDPSQEAALLAGLNQWLSPFDVVVTFNGKSFDLPLLNTRYTLNSVSSPFGAYDHLDLLSLARKLWRDRLPSRALGELEKQIIRFTRTGEDIPGWAVPQLYFDYLRTGDARPLNGIFYHNAMDILSLAALFNHMSSLLTEPDHMVGSAEGSGLDLAAIARLYEDQGWLERAAALYEASLAQGLPEEFFYKTVERYAVLMRRQGDWEQAERLWQRSAERGHYAACIELAKYYEHHLRNYPAALKWTEKAAAMIESTFRYSFSRREQHAELEQRANRIQKKMERKQMNPKPDEPSPISELRKIVIAQKTAVLPPEPADPALSEQHAALQAYDRLVSEMVIGMIQSIPVNITIDQLAAARERAEQALTGPDLPESREIENYRKYKSRLDHMTDLIKLIQEG